MTKKNTLDEFITQAKEKHGDKYDYSNVEYINTNTTIQIVCKLHGIFKKSPHSHLLGRGCCKCGGINKKKVGSVNKTLAPPVQRMRAATTEER